MNLHALRLFYTVAKLGSVTRAADELRISQPAVTKQIKQFEKDISTTLFVPRNRRIQLTDAGEILAEQAEKLFSLERQMEAYLKDYALGKTGTIRLAATYLPANFLIPAWAAQFKKEHEDVEMMITTMNSREAFNQLIHFEADVAVFGGGKDEQETDLIHWDELFQDELWFVVPKGHPFANKEISLEEMVTVPFIMREEGSSTRERLFALCKTYHVKAPKISLQFSGLNESIRAVLAGYGAIFISSLVVRDLVEKGELSQVYVKGVQLKNSIAIWTRKGEVLTPAVQSFVDLVKSSTHV
ncbi:LysR family transcriptional regulator [Bacillus horti]|uniref:DNA-binding transcriptional LysR family regulator n=1 Tax=Caldalkalibacillus horti TaxID=77523 RepID=A0ABT9W3X1_9BACI|nr:LysR family transcriptional regulator [Bacillus horti]MDQ0167946.1 DNA-binding transcriptional LysR family regulator [Bacillus horti]